LGRRAADGAGANNYLQFLYNALTVGGTTAFSARYVHARPSAT
jgi:hypothetical protein